MAISNSASVLALLKVWYKDGVENLMFRNSPLLKKITKTRVEGKQQNFAAMYGRGGAVGGDFTVAKTSAQNNARNVEFQVTPGQLFSVYSVNAKEVQASKTKRGAYMRVMGNKMFAAVEAFRKTLAGSLYGRGYGEIAILPTGTPTTIETTGTDITLSSDAIMKIDVGSNIVFKSSISAAATLGTAVVNAIDGNTVNVSAVGSAITIAAGNIVAIAGSMDASGNPALPVGLDAWLPTVANRTGNNWTAYIGTSFFGVNRSVATDRLAGAFVLGAADEKLSATVQKLILKCRRQGSQADLIVMNDEDFLELSKEVEATNTYFTQTSTKEKKNAVLGFDSFAASFSTNYIENIIDDPYCPKSKVYVLSSEAVELWSYTNTDKIDDGIAGNNPGKQDTMTMDGNDDANKPQQLIIDDYLNVQDGDGNSDGPDVLVTLQFFGSFVVTNPSVCGVGVLKGATDYLGYAA